jgi:hypothetical protein
MRQALVTSLARIVVGGLAAAFAVFVWPTRYHYDRMQLLGETAPGPTFPVRIDRFTGHAEILLPEILNDARHNMRLGWVGTPGNPLPADVLAELRTNVSVANTPLPYAQIFNTTDWRITRIRWDVVSPGNGEAGGSPVSRQFEQAVHIEPHAVARLYLELGRFGQDASVTFNTAWGTRR